MKAIVTGGAGFIGGHLLNLLNQNGHDAKSFDLKDSTGDKFIQGDVRDFDSLLKVCKGADVIFHLAAFISVPDSIKRPLVSHDHNVNGTLNVLEVARQVGAKVIFSSSAAIYGDSKTEFKSESEDVFPLSPYGLHKMIGEEYSRLYFECYGVNAVCLRYFNVYGPGQDPNSPYAAVIPSFLKALNEGKAPTIFGDGEQTRDFVFVGDIARANLFMAESNISNGVYNVASGKKTSVNELYFALRDGMGLSLEPIYAQPREGDIKHSLADNSKLKELGFSAEIELKEGIKKLLEK